MANLNSLLIARKMESELREALARQTAVGGDLATCLLEVAPLSETQVLALLTEAYGLATADPGDLLVDPLVLKFVPRATALRYGICPACQHSGALVLFVSEPLSPAIEEDLSFALGVPIEQRVALAARIAQAIARSYGAALSLRMRELLERLPGRSEAPPGIAMGPTLPLDPYPTPFAAAPAAIPRRDTLRGPRGNDPSSDATDPGARSANSTNDAISANSASYAGSAGSASSVGSEISANSASSASSTGAEVSASSASSASSAGAETSVNSASSARSVSSAGSAISANHGTLIGIPAARRDPRLDSQVMPRLRTRPPPDKLETSPKKASPALGQGPAVCEAEAQIPAVTDTQAHDAGVGETATRPPQVRRAADGQARPLSKSAPRNPPADFVMEATMTTAAEIEQRRRRRAARPSGTLALRDWARRALGLAEPSGRSERHRGPLTPAAAERALEDARSPDEALRVYFEFARQYFEYTALFRIHGELAEGHDAWGPGASRDKVRAIGLALDFPSVLSQARDRGLPLITTPSDDGIDAVLAEDLARSMRKDIACIPIKVRNRTLAVLFGDHGDESVRLETIGEVIALGSLLASALERILLRRKREIWRASQPPGPVISVGPDSGNPLAELLDAPSGSGPALTGPSDSLGKPEDARHPPAPAISVEAQEADSEQKLVDDGWAVLDQSNAKTPLLTEAARLLAETSATPSSDSPPGELPPGWAWPQTPTPFDSAPAVAAGLRPAPIPAIAREEPRDEPMYQDEPAMRPISGGPLIALGRIMPSPSNGDMLSVGARPPPQAAAISMASLPPVLIHADLVEAVIRGGPEADSALGEILELGEGALPSIFARFPGPLSVERYRAAQELPRPAACGPVLRVLAALRRLALPFLAVRSADTSPEVRFWATYLLCELQYHDSATALWPRLFDEDPAVRKIALHGAQLLVESGEAGGPIRGGLEHVIASTDEADHRRICAIEVASDLGRLSLVPALVRALDRSYPQVCVAAAGALRSLTGMDFGTDPRPWKKWWKSKGRSLGSSA